jgi:uncharacterized protein
MKLVSILAALAASHVAAAPLPSVPPDYIAWQAQRVESLTAEKGWLSLIGLHWVELGSAQTGSNKSTLTVGSGVDQQIRLGAGPKKLGLLRRNATGELVFTAVAPVMVNGAPGPADVVLRTDANGATPTEISTGTLSFFAIDRSGKIGLRVKDSAAASRTGFKGLDYFAYLAERKITARYIAYKTPRTIEIATIIGTVEPTPNPGHAQFTLDGKKYDFELLEGSDATHFFTVFGDKTNGHETYGMARFLAGEINVKNKTVTLDFNRAYNPPCAFTEFATCPMPPASNRIASKVLAGERAYRGARKE